MVSAPYGDDEQFRRVPPATTYVMADFAWRDPVGGVDGGPGPDGMPTGCVDAFDGAVHIHHMAVVPAASAVPDRPWPDRKLEELGEMFVTALAFLWLGTGALVYLVVGLLMVAFVVVVAPPVRLYLLARDAWCHRSKARRPVEDFGDWNPW